MRYLRTTKRKIRSWNNHRRSLVSLRWKRWLPRLVIHEKYEAVTKWLVRILTLAGIILSIGFIPIWYVNLIVAIILVGFEQFLERAIFLYTSIFWQPLPEFRWDLGEEWISMGFAFPENPTPEDLNILGPVFKSENCAQEFMNIVKIWNYNHEEDIENNICLSFIIEDSNRYFTYIYPNLRRQSVKEAFSKIEEMRKFYKFGKEHQQLVVEPVFSRSFSSPPDSKLNKFIQTQQNNEPFWFQPLIQYSAGNVKILFSIKPILKHQVKIKKRTELEQHELEYQHRINEHNTK